MLNMNTNNNMINLNFNLNVNSNLDQISDASHAGSLQSNFCNAQNESIDKRSAAKTFNIDKIKMQ
jgi:hypothetical protein